MQRIIGHWDFQPIWKERQEFSRKYFPHGSARCKQDYLFQEMGQLIVFPQGGKYFTRNWNAESFWCRIFLENKWFNGLNWQSILLKCFAIESNLRYALVYDDPSSEYFEPFLVQSLVRQNYWKTINVAFLFAYNEHWRSLKKMFSK